MKTKTSLKTHSMNRSFRRCGGVMGLLSALALIWVAVLPAVRAQLGFGRLRVAYVGDSPVPPEIDRWARALGITVRYYNPFQKGETNA